MGLPALLADYLFLGPLIAERLADQVPDVPVSVIETTAQLLAEDRRQRSVMVMWAGDAFGDSAGHGRFQKITQRWLVVLGLNNVAPATDARHQVAGPMLSQLHQALAGWTPPDCNTPLQRAQAQMRPDFTKTKALYPLGFEINLTL